MSSHTIGRSRKIGSAVDLVSQSSKTRNFVKQAIKANKIFLVHPWFPAVKAALRRRGWVEKICKFPPRASALCQDAPSDEELTINKSEMTDYADQAWTDRLLQDYPPNFMWLFNQSFDCRILDKAQIVNMHPQQHLALKVDLVACMQTMQWYTQPPLARTLLPRGYRLGVAEEKTAFIRDFNLTACISLLSWIAETYEEKGQQGLMSDAGRANAGCVDFARTQVEQYLFVKTHEDLDWLCQQQLLTNNMSWDTFLENFRVLVTGESSISMVPDPESACARMYDIATKTLKNLQPYWPQLEIDGFRNIWICKPGKGSRGEGIVLLNELPKIINLPPRDFSSKEMHWVIQKYIERPLLIHETKFDIRQWFLVTSFSPLTVWFYRESYLKFTSRPFSLDDLGECVHLCNYAVQKRFENAPARHSELPEDNMWDSEAFRKYLQEKFNLGYLWDERIYPRMKQLIMGVLFARQDYMEVRRNSFQLYGADIMIAEDFIPWLIEINSFPSMELSSAVCARLCPQVMEDSIKVVLDRKINAKADTGMFELIYRPKTPPRIAQKKPNPLEVTIKGAQIVWDIDWPWSNKPTNKPTHRYSTASLAERSRSTHRQQSRQASLASTPKSPRSRAPSAKSSRVSLSGSGTRIETQSATRPSKSTGVLTRGKKSSVARTELRTATPSKLSRESSQHSLASQKTTNFNKGRPRSGVATKRAPLSPATARPPRDIDETNNNKSGSKSLGRRSTNKI